MFTVYVFLQHHKAHKVGKMQLVVEKIVLAILLSSVVESTAQTLRECDFKVDDVSCPRTTSLLLQLIISIVTIKTNHGYGNLHIQSNDLYITDVGQNYPHLFTMIDCPVIDNAVIAFTLQVQMDIKFRCHGVNSQRLVGLILTFLYFHLSYIYYYYCICF